MKRKSYYKAVWLNRIYDMKCWLWSSIGWRFSISEPNYPPLIPKKPKNQSERDGDIEKWSSYYTWKEYGRKSYSCF